eukprot:snap_masked-scaffold_1-processed-gene-15.22-mRNA-1 protein AED:1.00 eAED:1.00 QI:0/-1/0/0/-1/1/1/0/413
MSDDASTPKSRGFNAKQVANMLNTATKDQMNSLGVILSNLLREGDIHVLEKLETEDIKRFIYEYERMDDSEKKEICLKRKLGEEVFGFLEGLGKTGTSEDIIAMLKELLKDEQMPELRVPEVLIRENIKFNHQLKDEYAVTILFKQVDKLLAEMPPEAERKPKAIACAIFDLLPPYFCVHKEDLSLRPALKARDRSALKEYVLECLPSRRIRDKFRKEFGITGRREKKETKKKINTVGEGEDEVGCSKLVFEELPGHRWLCPYCYKYGHMESRCFRKQRNQAPVKQPTLDEIQKKYEVFKARKKEKKTMKKMEKTPSVTEESGENKPDEQEIELFKTPFKMIRGGARKYDFNLVQGDAEVEVRLGGSEQRFVALLDSGAFRSAINIKLKKYCSKVVKFRQPLKVTVAGGENIW